MLASPDTDELATLPLPTGTPDPARPQREPAEGGARTAAQAEESSGAAETVGEGEAHTVPQDRVEPERIEPETEPDTAAPAKESGRWWRGFTGSLAAGLAVLALGVLVVAGVCLYTGAPGPGMTLLIGHPVAAVLALLAQRVADRRNGPAAIGAGVAVVLFAVSALTLFWLT